MFKYIVSPSEPIIEEEKEIPSSVIMCINECGNTAEFNNPDVLCENCWINRFCADCEDV